MIYDWHALGSLLDGMRSQLESHQPDIILVLAASTFLIFVLILIVFVRAMRLRKQIDILRMSVQRLNNVEEMRFLKELRAPSKTNPSDQEPES